MDHSRIKCVLPILLVLVLLLVSTGCQSNTDSGGGDTAPASGTSAQQQDDAAKQETSEPADSSREEAADPEEASAGTNNESDAAQPEETPATSEAVSSGRNDASSSGALSGFTICLDPGHGITSQSKQEAVSPLSSEQKPAYVSGASGNSQTEEALNLAVAELVKVRLEGQGATVVMTRTTHEAAVSNIERARIANEAGADLCIRIHADGAENTSASGFSILVPSGSLLGTPSIITPSRAAAVSIEQALKKTIDAQDRGLAERSDMTGFNWSEVPVVLVEMGFLTNPEEDRKLSTESYRNAIADGIANGTENWLLNINGA